MTSLTIGQDGEIALPSVVRERYGFKPDTPVRIIETRSGILLIPVSNLPMSKDLQQEIAEWQAVGTATWELFPYEEAGA